MEILTQKTLAPPSGSRIAVLTIIFVTTADTDIPIRSPSSAVPDFPAR